MKILQVITSLATGGAEMLVTELSILLRKRGHEVDVAVFNAGASPMKEKLLQNGCHVFELGHSFYSPKLLFKLWKLMKGYDIVHSHNSSPQMYTAMASLLCSVERCSTEHNTSNRKRGWKWYAPIDRWMYDRYPTIICISQQAEANLKTYLKTYRSDLVTIPNGVDIKRFRESAPQPDLTKEKKRFAIAMVAAFRYQKDQDTMVRAMALLPKDKFELWFVGDGERRPAVEALTRELGVEDNVRFLGIRRDIPEVLHAADAVCMSSHFEGLSLSSIEGMCVGKPFIASDVDGLREITQGAGILFPHSDAQALADIILQLHADPSYAREIAEQCYERASQYDINKTVVGYEKVYNALMQQGGGTNNGAVQNTIPEPAVVNAKHQTAEMRHAPGTCQPGFNELSDQPQYKVFKQRFRRIPDEPRYTAAMKSTGISCTPPHRRLLCWAEWHKMMLIVYILLQTVLLIRRR